VYVLDTEALQDATRMHGSHRVHSLEELGAVQEKSARLLPFPHLPVLPVPSG